MSLSKVDTLDTGGIILEEPPLIKKKKQISPSVKWMFTLNNWKEEDRSEIIRLIELHCKVAVFGEEVGKSGTKHLQGYVEFKDKKRPKSVFNFTENIHWDKPRGSNTRAECAKYCNKGDKVYQLGIKLPEKVKVITEDMLFDWQIAIIDLINGPIDDRKIYWYWSEEGNVGKTSFCKYLVVKYGGIPLAGKSSDVKNGVCAYMEANHNCTPKLVLYPIPRCTDESEVNYDALENIKDMFFYSGKYKGGIVCGNSPHLFVFANMEPMLHKMSKDRWIVVEIK